MGGILELGAPLAVPQSPTRGAAVLCRQGNCRLRVFRVLMGCRSSPIYDLGCLRLSWVLKKKRHTAALPEF